MWLEPADFFPDVPDEERAHLIAAAQQTLREAQAWAAGSPLVRSARLPAAALVHQASAPRHESALVLVQQYCLLAYIDDVFDERLLPDDQRRQFTDGVLAAVRGLAPARPGTITGELRLLRERLARSPLFDALESYWVSGFDDYVAGQWRESQWSDESSWEQYLEARLLSIAYAMYGSSLLILAADRSALDHVPEFLGLARSAGIAMGMANDLMSHARESREGAANGLEVLRRAGVPLKLGRERMEDDIDTALKCLAAAAEQPLTASGMPERALYRGTLAVVRLYAKDDFNTYQLT